MELGSCRPPAIELISATFNSRTGRVFDQLLVQVHQRPLARVANTILPRLHLSAVDFHARFPLMPSVIDLCAILQRKTWYHVEKLFNRYKAKVPESAGEYVINVSNPAGEFFTRAKPMIL